MHSDCILKLESQEHLDLLKLERLRELPIFRYVLKCSSMQVCDGARGILTCLSSILALRPSAPVHDFIDALLRLISSIVTAVSLFFGPLITMRWAVPVCVLYIVFVNDTMFPSILLPSAPVHDFIDALLRLISSIVTDVSLFFGPLITMRWAVPVCVFFTYDLCFSFLRWSFVHSWISEDIINI